MLFILPLSLQMYFLFPVKFSMLRALLSTFVNASMYMQAFVISESCQIVVSLGVCCTKLWAMPRFANKTGPTTYLALVMDHVIIMSSVSLTIVPQVQLNRYKKLVRRNTLTDN